MERSSNSILLSTYNYCESINYYNSILYNFHIYAITIPFKQKFYMPK